jgi:hypothetical protein
MDQELLDLPSALGLFAHEPSPDFLATGYSLGAARMACADCPGSRNPLSLAEPSRSPDMVVGAWPSDFLGDGAASPAIILPAGGANRWVAITARATDCSETAMQQLEDLSSLDGFGVISMFIRPGSLTPPANLFDSRHMQALGITIRQYYRGRLPRRIVASTKVLLTADEVTSSLILELSRYMAPPVFVATDIRHAGQPVPWRAKVMDWREFDSIDAAVASFDLAVRDKLVFWDT